MKTHLFKSLAATFLLLIPLLNFAQAPPLGTASEFVLFTSVGAMTNVGTYQYLTLLTGNVGTNSGSNTNFGNVNGVMHSGDGVTFQCDADLIIARDFLVAAIHDSAIVNPVLGKDSTLMAGTYLLPATAVSLDLSLTLDAQGDPNAVFIFKMAAVAPVYAFSTSANAKVKLINGAQACNVYWYISGAVSLAAGTSMKGTIIAGGAFDMGANDTLEGRALTINGAVTVDNGDLGFLGYLPVDISAPLPTGPAAPVFVESKDYAIFSSIGNVSDDGTSHVDGSVGGNSAAPTGFNPLFVSGNIDGMNPATAAAAADLILVYNSLNTLTPDIELLAPAQFGHNLVLTPNTYIMNSAATFTDTVFMDACGNADAVFIIKTYGAFASGVNSRVVLMRGAQAKNVYWMVNGAVSIGDGSIFNGTIVANNGAIDLLTGATLNGRALTTNGAISVTAMSTILPYPPLVITDPVSQTVCEGDSTGFIVEATGSGPFTYQWRKGNVNLMDGGNISGVNNDTLIFDPVSLLDVASDYNVIVSGPIEPNDTSVFVSLTVNTPPNITIDPVNQIGCLGDSISFTLTSTGTALTYQWRKGVVNIIGETNDTLTIDPIALSDAALNYNVVISGTCAPNATSANASLTVNTAPAITTEPVDQTANVGSSVSFTIVATGSGLTYQWRKGIVNITGETSAMLTIDPVAAIDAAINYNVVVSGTCSPNDTSVNVALTVNMAPSIVTQPINQVACTGDSVSFVVSATGSGLTYQWRIGTVNITGATNDTLTIDPVAIADAATNYNVVVSGILAPVATSVDVSLTVNSAPVITTEPVNQIAIVGGSASFTVVATGSGLSYQWRIGTVNITGETSAILTIDPVALTDAALNYNVVVNGTCAPNATSVNVSLTVNLAGTAPNITTEPVDQTICVGSSASFSVVATGTALTYQWRKGNVDLVNGGNISGATSDALIIDPVAIGDVAANYNVVVSGTIAPNDTSVNVSLVVNTAPLITAQPANQSVCNGSSASFSVTATGTGLTYQWRKGTVNIAGATSAMLTIDPVTLSNAASNYNVVVSGTCSINYSANASLTVNSAPAITLEPVNQKVCEGKPVSFSVTATGAGITYQWRKGAVNITGATLATFTIDPVALTDAAVNYNVVVTGTCTPSITSDDVTLVVDPISTDPIIIIPPISQIMCPGCPVYFSVEATGTGLTYQWRKGEVDLVDGGTIFGATNDTLIIVPMVVSDTASNYNVVVTGLCTESVKSAYASLILCNQTGVSSIDAGKAVIIYPNPFTTSLDIIVNDASLINSSELKVFNILGIEVMMETITKNSTSLNTSNLPSGVYFYIVINNGQTIQTGKLISRQ